MANVTQIPNKQLTDVLAEFEQEAEQFAVLNINANDICVRYWPFREECQPAGRYSKLAIPPAEETPNFMEAAER